MPFAMALCGYLRDGAPPQVDLQPSRRLLAGSWKSGRDCLAGLIPRSMLMKSAAIDGRRVGVRSEFLLIVGRNR